MLDRIVGAGLRAVLAALLVATPALALPGTVGASGFVLPLICFIAAAFVFVEYFTDYPSVVEFRDAPPFNRLRFACLWAVVLTTAILCADLIRPTLLSGAIAGLGGLAGAALDFPYSPVRLMLISVADTSGTTMLEAVRAAAGLSCFYAAVTLVAFALSVRRGWPVRHTPFNVWINMPLFDPTGGGDIVLRLRREGRANLVLGALVPFVLPALIKLVTLVVGPLRLSDPHTLIWVMSVWAFLPVSMIMRAIALFRVAEMIESRRRRATELRERELAPA
ncbi:hypothetical protein [Rhodosalinus halophilus]|uniref:hypothetical protein n=1 Tax=Rhodosalinus halophilus TaxID=2259333 RepID=UPI001F36F487|nr:hypothetical protein [Rhodosalinus halophilus]